MRDALPPALHVRDLEAWYGESHVLHGMTLRVEQGEVVTLVGRNGAGKTTTLRAIMGMLEKVKGAIDHEGKDLLALRSNQIARRGIGYCPEERGIFASLSVEENLMLPVNVSADGMEVAELYTLFPNLAERRHGQANKLSGGEQQMLAIARILRTGATLLLLDEPTEGLAPAIVQQIARMFRLLRERAYTILLVEQNVRFASKLADRHYVVEHGKVIDMLSSDDLAIRRSHIETYLGV
ncbi:ABC transporter ATP-binding protein [Mesorhizobium sp. 1B3]|uniref:ABC transporter ATP-binding protein n=1 Tax=Mesorhizobium sp. 1B3 TaxID=3243599 RepID=UPI003D98A992